MSLIGSVDMIAETCVAGWAADDAEWKRGVCVEVIVNSARVATVQCGEFRADLQSAGIGDGCKAFRYGPSVHFRPGRNVVEVRYAGTRETVPKGRGVWVKRRAGGAGAAWIAALESYYEFKPEHHICAIGEGAESLESAFAAAGVPFREYTARALPGGKADLVVWPLCDSFSTAELKRLVKKNIRRPGFLAIGLSESAVSAAEVRRAFRECGIPGMRFESIALAEGQPARMFAFAEVGGMDRSEVEAEPVLAHIHVPKCAGTSLRVLLERYWGGGQLPLYVDDTYFVYGEETLRNYLRVPGIRGFSSHHVRSFPHWLGGRELLYVTFLRDPVQQFVSYMTHFKKHYANITDRGLLEAVPPDAPLLSLRDFARWLLTQDRDIPFRENHNVNFFARYSSPGALDRLAAAKAALSGFFFVGIAERMEESMIKLRALARAAGLDFPPGSLPKENVSSEYRDDLAWIHPGDEVGSLLLHSVEKDRQLYEWALAHFNRTCDPACD